MKKFSKMFAMIAIILSLSVIAGCKGSEKGKGPLPSPSELTLKLWAEPAVINSGDRTTIQWQSNLVGTTCRAVKGPWEGGYGGNGSFTTPTLTEDTVFGLMCECGDFKIASKEVTVRVNKTQPAACKFAAAPARIDLTSCKAGKGRFTVTRTQGNPNDCPFPSSLPGPSWLTAYRISPSCSTCDSAEYEYDMPNDNNTGSTQVGDIVVSQDCKVPITRPHCPPVIPCSFDVFPIMASFTCPGGDVVFTVKTGDTCGWAPESTIPGISFVDPKWTVGSGKVTLRATPNGTSPRVGEVKIAGKFIPVDQTACPVQPQTCQDTRATNYGGPLPCVFPPTSCTRTADVSIDVTENFTCPDGSVKSATVTVSGYGSETRENCADAQTAANQEAQADAQTKVPAARTQARANAQALCPATVPCTFVVQGTPLNWNWDSTSNSGVVVSTQPGCDWSVSATQNWVAFPERTSGSGPGDFKVAPGSNNTSTTTRNATVTFTGEGGYTQTIPVSQSGKPATTCTYAVQNTQITFSWNPSDNAGVVVSTQAGCNWSVAPTATWLYVDRTNGTGPGDFKIGAAGNGGGERNAKIRVTGDGGFLTEIPVKQNAKP